jgi:hypothetical protein
MSRANFVAFSGLLSVATLLLSFPASASAQDESVVRTADGYRIIQPGGTHTFTLPSAAVLLKEFEHEVANPSAAGTMGTVGLTKILRRPDKFPPATVDTILNGLEDLSLTSNHALVRQGAASHLSLPGGLELGNPRPGTVARMLRVYRRSNDMAVRLAVLGSLPKVAERAQAIAFVRSVAMQAREDQDFPGSAHEAIGILAWGSMSAEGCVVLRQLLAAGRISEQRARASATHAVTRGTCRDARP